jgi:hypothetical protein
LDKIGEGGDDWSWWWYEIAVLTNYRSTSMEGCLITCGFSEAAFRFGFFFLLTGDFFMWICNAKHVIIGCVL